VCAALIETASFAFDFFGSHFVMSCGRVVLAFSLHFHFTSIIISMSSQKWDIWCSLCKAKVQTAGHREKKKSCEKGGKAAHF
jgi:hypothetical protein